MSEVKDFLFELGTEELPPKALKKLGDAFAEGVLSGLKDARLAHGAVEVFAAPRRLALLIIDLEVQQADESFERHGPAVQAAYKDGQPTKAAEGFARSCGVTVDQLATEWVGKVEKLVFRGQQQGQATQTLIPEIIQTALDKLPIPKRMRWGSSRDEFVRPVQWMLCLFGQDVLPMHLFGVQSGGESYGHRFHAPQAIKINEPKAYATTLRSAGKVMASFEERKALIEQQTVALAAAEGVVADIDADLLDEVTALNEWPVALAGRFDQDFLSVPAEALISSMQGHQKYFPTRSADGNLSNVFIFIANLESKDPSQVISGNEKVIRPRLADAKFFWDTDCKASLASRLPKLEKIVFQNQLGTLAEKSQRVASLASGIAEQLGYNAAWADQAALLAKADLVSDMVFEFDELQGIAGRYLAHQEGLPAEVAEAIAEHYQPKFAGDELPATNTGVVVALAERLDTLSGLFAIDMLPTGTKDPYALRRASIGVLRLLVEKDLKLDLAALIERALANFASLKFDAAKVKQTLIDYMLDRFAAWYADQGISTDVFQAVRASGSTSPADIDHRVKAVAQFKSLEAAADLAAANKRVGNLLAKAEGDLPSVIDVALFAEPAEEALLAKLSDLQSKTANESDYVAVLTELSALREPVNQYFDQVMVMADDLAVRGNRLALLAQLRALFLRVADISVLQL